MNTNINIILGISIDTLDLVEELKNMGEECIVILDYDLTVDTTFVNGLKYVSQDYAKRLIHSNRSIKFYKSINIYPGMYKNKEF